ncbi:MAG: hypothetical protein ACI81R_002396 [Bradymonadia bacterium]|jgi:hypothetical protein
MSVERTNTVDAVAVRDGWVIVSIMQLAGWSELEEPAEQLRWKLRTAFEHIQSGAFQAKYHALPVRVELQGVAPTPDEVSEICTDWGIVLFE